MHNTNSKTSTAYTWGFDLSDSLQGAGGVGGLVLVSRDSGNYAPHYDVFYNLC